MPENDTTPVTYAAGGPVSDGQLVGLSGCVVYPPLPRTPAPRIPDVAPVLDENPGGELLQIEEVIRRFHYDEHGGPFRFCSGRPCREVNDIRHGVLL